MVIKLFYTKFLYVSPTFILLSNVDLVSVNKESDVFSTLFKYFNIYSITFYGCNFGEQSIFARHINNNSGICLFNHPSLFSYTYSISTISLSSFIIISNSLDLLKLCGKLNLHLT